MHPFYAKYFRQKYFRNQIKNVARDRCGEEVAYTQQPTRVLLTLLEHSPDGAT